MTVEDIDIDANTFDLKEKKDDSHADYDVEITEVIIPAVTLETESSGTELERPKKMIIKRTTTRTLSITGREKLTALCRHSNLKALSGIPQAKIDDYKSAPVITEQPEYILGAMKNYQIDGLNWLISRHDHAVGGTLILVPRSAFRILCRM